MSDIDARPNSYAPKEFLEKLRRDEAGLRLCFTGIAEAPGEGDAILFAHGTDCASWVKIPVGMLQAVEALGAVSCNQHAHSAVNIYLKEPQSEEGRVFSSLAQWARRTIPHAVMGRTESSAKLDIIDRTRHLLPRELSTLAQLMSDWVTLGADVMTADDPSAECIRSCMSRAKTPEDLIDCIRKCP